MSYQVLARKWRPKTFAELSGQEHVVQALSNALERGRLHHAYLLTGTRGVGKTTIARILAKSLNCLTNGVTATPCGMCAACVDIDAGRFVDLLELDAASNTGIDNMREILDNARYAPTVGRYKVYLIDEVHMLSKAAFNSMLKTLEEPPEHVKFVLATTDPQKIPVTVLSRCLQFNLKLLPASLISARLAEILRAEAVPFDDAAIGLVARTAHGSMRDALSVLDQAIAYGAGEVREGVVRTMLGTVDAEYGYRIADALIVHDGPALLAEARALTERGVSLAAALEELAALFHRIAIAQTVPDAVDALPDAGRLKALAATFTPDAVQLAYQICVQGRADLALAPDEPTGFSMTLLRLLAFEPVTERGHEAKNAAPGGREAARRSVAPEASALAPASSVSDTPARDTAAPIPGEMALPAPAEWPAFVAGMNLSGIALQLAAQTELKTIAGTELVLTVPEAARHLTDKPYADKLKAAIEQTLGRRVRLRFEVGQVTDTTLAAQEKREREAARASTEAAFRDDPFVQDVLSRFDARIKPNSIKPV
jgi:DNA polymerase III subunit gamma/tau